ncbi:MAG: dihydrodipicolinate synthase family protein [Verrucomicrobiota bacterium]|nr:dihydrodipicolinate synthase family protein [Verrucomicrobiota bacterium]
MKINDIPQEIISKFRRGTVIPAQPLALDEQRQFDREHQAAITRYYIDAGVGGIAVGVHSTQFEIRDPGIDLFEPVLSFTSNAIDEYCSKQDKKVLKIAGICGKTEQAVKEAEFAISSGYHAGLLSLAAFSDSTVSDMISHCSRIAEIIPIIGFYLQTSVGGRKLPFSFWRQFAEIKNVLAIKIAPFNRYHTLDVVRAVCEAGRENDITLYTGNDDNILVDLLTNYRIVTSNGVKNVRIKGGLLGHWCVWTKKAVELLDKVHKNVGNDHIPAELLQLNVEITDSNAAFFDAANDFAGCIPGIHEVLRRQGLMKGRWCLNSDEIMSPGQKEEIDRVYASYPHLNDDEFVKKNIHKWLGK